MQGSDPFEQPRVRSFTRRRLALLPRVVPAGGDAQCAAHHADPMLGLMLAHEPERLLGVDCVSCANQAAAFFSISRSSRSVRFSRRSWTNSARSSVVSPSVCLPSSRSACRTQFRIDCAVGSNFRASASGLCPARTSSIRRRRNSSGYGGGGADFFGIVGTSGPNGQVFPESGPLQKLNPTPGWLIF